MKMEAIILIILMFCVSGCLWAVLDEYQIYDCKTGKTVSLNGMAKKLKSKDVIFFGEFHDDALLHRLEAEFLTAFYQQKASVIVSMEMFERDTQSFLNQYLQGEITEEVFLHQSRPWPNYQTDYRPLVEYAKANQLPVLAANVPRRIAALVAKNGVSIMDSLRGKDKSFAAERLVVLDDEYKTAFMKTMQATMSPMHNNNILDNIYAAQCLKDDTMAESITNALLKHKKHSVIHFNGDFHSNAWLGTAQKVKLLYPKAKIAVITPLYIDAQTAFKFDSTYKKYGDFVILIHKQKNQQDSDD